MKDIVEFLHNVEKLKTLKRQGWIDRGVKKPESVADHSFRMAIMALVLSTDEGLDQNKCVKMALIHDLAEAITGDITPHDKVGRVEKRKLELKAMKTLLKKIKNTEIFKLWEEYEDQKTRESRFVKDIDRTEMLFQAHEYEKRQDNIDLSEFWPDVKSNIRDKKFIEMYKILEK